MLGVRACELDIDRREPLAGLGRGLAELDLFGTEPPERRAELGRARGLGVGPLAHRRLEPLDVDVERRLEPQRACVQTLEHELVGPAGAGRVGVSQRARRHARALGRMLGRLGGLGGERRKLFCLRAKRREIADRVGGAATRAALGGERAPVGLRGRVPQLALTDRDAPQVFGEPAGPLGQRRLEARGGARRDAQSLVQPLGTRDEPAETRRIGVPDVAQVRDRREDGRRGAGDRGGLLDVCAGSLGTLVEPLDLDPQLTSARLELEQHGLGRLAGEPQLAAAGVPADPVLGHGGHPRGEQLVACDDRQLHELSRILSDQHEHRAEARRLRLRDELQPATRRRGEHRRGAMTERCGGRALRARLDLEHLERELLAFLGEGARRGRDSLALRERLLECGQPLARELHARLEVVPLAHGGACGGVGLVGRQAELGRRRAP